MVFLLHSAGLGGAHKRERELRYVEESTVDNCTNTHLSAASPLSGPGFVVFNVVMLLGVVFPVTACCRFSCSCGLGPRNCHCENSSSGAGEYLSLLPPIIACRGTNSKLHCRDHPQPFTSELSTKTSLNCSSISDYSFGVAARLMFMATFAVIVHIIVRYACIEDRVLGWKLNCMHAWPWGSKDDEGSYIGA